MSILAYRIGKIIKQNLLKISGGYFLRRYFLGKTIKTDFLPGSKGLLHSRLLLNVHGNSSRLKVRYPRYALIVVRR